MHLGRVIGTVVAERKYEGLEGVKLLVVDPIDHAGEVTGPPLVAARGLPHTHTVTGPTRHCHLKIVLAFCKWPGVF